MEKNNKKRAIFDVIIVGSGIAGLYAALKASDSATVCLVMKGSLSDTNTWLAQGGIAAAVCEYDSPAEHFADTVAAGAGACNEKAVTVMVEEGPGVVQDLLALGTPFDWENGRLALTREGAHHKSRVLHCGGDATGRLIQQTLQNAVISRRSVTVREHDFVTDLVVEDNVVYGVRTFRGETLLAGAVILATGGLGQAFLRTTNPAVATGDGIAMAYRAGAQITDMEFVQFHPTVFQGRREDETFLISEAVRGEGGVLRNSKGERFMKRYHPLAELGPRDVVARAILAESKKQGGTPVWLDITHKERTFLATRFPTIYEKSRQRGFDMAVDWLPVAPAAHYAMGGIATGLNGESSLPGLYACGEVACSGVHGANRLASNSLLEGLVFASRAVAAIGRSGSTVLPGVTSQPQNDTASYCKEAAEAIRLRVRQRMFEDAGLIRDGGRLVALQNELYGLAAEIPAGEAGKGVWEVRNILTVAQLIVAGALWRTESRGGHYRTDYPTTDMEFNRDGTTVNKEEQVYAPIAV
jgi:L-aspartate oxidase